MSEYQYYEFRAVDRPLTDKQMQELRRYSLRAEITSTSFAVEYNWGDFKGKPHRWMEEYFDAFVHVANWGTRWFMLRLPRHLLDEEIASEYCDDDYLSFNAKDENLVLSFRSDQEDGEWVDGEDWMSSLIALRDDLMKGDHRCLYLAWLRSIQGMDYGGGVDEEAIEPPLPAGLRNLNTPLEHFADFLGLDFDLVTAAAEESQDNGKLQPSSSEIVTWVRNLSQDEKDALLVRIIEDDISHQEAALRQRAISEMRLKGPDAGDSDQRRTIAKILARANEITTHRERIENERAEQERVRRAREQAEKRRRHLESLRGRETDLWSKANQLIATKQPGKYDEAVLILQDLRDLAEKDGITSTFPQRLKALWSEHAKKPSLLKRLRKVKLAPELQAGATLLAFDFGCNRPP